MNCVNLPFDLLGKIFYSYGLSANDIAKSRRVCTLFKRVIDDDRFQLFWQSEFERKFERHPYRYYPQLNWREKYLEQSNKFDVLSRKHEAFLRDPNEFLPLARKAFAEYPTIGRLGTFFFTNQVSVNTEAIDSLDPEWQFYTGLYLFESCASVTIGRRMSIHYLALAAFQNFTPSFFYLGYCYDYASGQKKNIFRAFHYYQRGADQGCALAQNNLAIFYRVAKNMKLAFQYFKASADQGFAKAQFNTGLCYERGDGVKVNHSEAFKYYKMAADQGDGWGQYNVGIYCFLGLGTQVNQPLSLKYMQLAQSQRFFCADQWLNNEEYRQSVNAKKNKHESAGEYFQKMHFEDGYWQWNDQNTDGNVV